MFKNLLFNKFNVLSETSIQVIWWYLVVVISTLYFKNNYFDAIYHGGISVIIETQIKEASSVKQLAWAGLLFIRNFAEVAIYLTFLYLVACKLLRVNLKVVITITIFTVLLFGVANLLSLNDLGKLLSLDTLMISIDWIKDNPEVINSYTRKRNIAYFGSIVVLAFLPVLASIGIRKFPIFLVINRVLALIVFLFIFVSSLLYFSIGLFIKGNGNIIPYQGYWPMVFSSLVSNPEVNPLEREVPSEKVMRSNYLGLIYPDKDIPYRSRKEYVFPENTIKRHIVIVSLETAPRKYYPIANNPEFKNLYRMSRNAIVSNLHFTTSPYTQDATYSMLTGTYVPNSGIPIYYGKMAFDGPAKVLSNQGYIPTYIDSYKIDWHEGDRNYRTIQSYGFKRIFDRTSYDFNKATKDIPNLFEKGLYAETASFKKAQESIAEAEATGNKAFVFIDTILGHYEWKSRKGNENLSNREKILEILGAFDDLLGEFLDFLQERDMKDDVIVVVTGDHGLRYHKEYQSLGENVSDVNISFNVPLMIYAPGLFQKQVVLKSATSHVDLAPTLLNLVGVDESYYFYHGENMLDPAFDNRIVFMMNQGLKPENSFRWKGDFYTYNYLSGKTFRGCNNSSRCSSDNGGKIGLTDSVLSPAEIIEKLDRADEIFSDSSASFLQRVSKYRMNLNASIPQK